MPINQDKVLIFDNGAGRIKYGRYLPHMQLPDYEPSPSSQPNCTAKINKQMQVLVGEDIDQFANGALLQYTRPFDRGYLNNWSIEIDVWSKIFAQFNLSASSHGSNVSNFNEYTLVMTEAPFTPEPWQDDTNEVIYEYFGFQAFTRRPSAWFSAYNYYMSNPTRSMYPHSSIVIDSGFSFTHVIPFIDLKCVKPACKRVNVGGKLLTNYLKEIISYRQWNMMDEFKLMDQVKEELCYVSNDFLGEFKRCKTSRGASRDPFGEKLKKYFILPDFQQVMRGYIKPDDEQMRPNDEQVLTMESERFAVPEVLFHPSDIGIDMAGVAEACGQSCQALSSMERGLCASNIILTGGSVSFPQFQERFNQEVRPLISDDCEVQTYLPSNPSEYAWKGAYKYVDNLFKSNTAHEVFITKAQYLEYGSHYCNAKFFECW